MRALLPPRPCGQRAALQLVGPDRAAFTLLELLVVCATVGILISLLLPAIQAARETARRMQCTSHLVQHLMAVHNYQTFHRVYPTGTVDSKRPIVNRPVGYHHNWIVQLLPLLERKSVAQHIDRQVGVYHRNNVAVRKLGMRFLNCPSSARADGYSHYAAVHHHVESPIDVDNHGTFFLNSRIAPDDVTDGLSHTVFLGEKLCEEGDLGWMSGTRGTLRNMGERINTARRLRAWGFAPPNLPGLPRGRDDETADLVVPAEADSDQEGVAPQAPRQAVGFVGGFSSYHAHGANFAFGDGSVRWLPEGTSVQVLRQFADRRDGGLVEVD